MGKKNCKHCENSRAIFRGKVVIGYSCKKEKCEYEPKKIADLDCALKE